MKYPVRNCILLFFLFLILSHQTFPQTNAPEKIQFKHFTKEEGFSENFIWCILQDHKGFIWIGTQDRLIRYDGLHFKLYKNSSFNINSLGGNTILVLSEDKTGVIWVGTGGGGLNRYNSEDENFTRYVYNPNDTTSISSNYIMSIYEDKSGTLWIGTDLGLNVFNRGSEKFIRYKNVPEDLTSLSSNIVTFIHEDSKSNLWIGTIDGGLNKFDPSKHKFTRYLHNPNDPTSLSNNNIGGICEDNSGDIWISTLGGGLNKLVNKDDEHPPVFKHFIYNPNNPAGLNDNDITSMYIDPRNIMWLGTWGGGLSRTISVIDEHSPLSFISYKHDPGDPSSLSINNIRYIYQDKSGLFWVATWGGGLHLFNTEQKQFKHYKHKRDDSFSLSANAVLSIHEDKSGTLWIGNWDGGLNKMDRATNKFSHYKNNPNDPNSLSDNTVSVVYEDRTGTLWVGTWNGGLNKFDRRTKKFYHYRHDPSNPKSISDDRILSITEDELGILWIGTMYGGLNKFEKDNERFSHFKYSPDNPNGLSSTDVHVLFIDNSGILWIGTKRGGLDALELRTEKFFHYKYDPSDLNSLSNNKISSIYEDKSGTVWIGTQEGGLNKLDRVNGKFRHFKMENGLPSDFVTGILEDDHGNLWLSTTNGLSKFNPQTETFRNYDVEDGLQSNEFEELSAYCKSKTGELIFGGVNGFNIFYPDSIKDNTHIPPVYITDFQLFNKPVPIGYDSLSGRTILSKSIIECEEIELNYDDKVFSFEFAALDYHAPLKNKYAYIMEGFDKDWNYTDAIRNLATYTNLDPGEYTFRVKGSNNDGIWNEAGASLKIIILPPWYQTTIAYLIYILLIGSVIYFVWKAQLKKIKIKHDYEMSQFEAKKLHEVDEIKTRFFTNISHEFRTPLTLILGPSKQLLESSGEEKTKITADLIHRSAKKLNRLVDELLDISKIEAGEMQLKACPKNLVAVVKEIALSFNSLAERKKITFRLNSDSDEIVVYIDKDKVDKILTNVLSNAFKFTPEGGCVDVGIHIHPEFISGSQSVSATSVNIKIPKLVRDDRFVEISIRDTGVGIPQNQIDKIFDRFYQVDGSYTREHEGTGIGLSLTKELIELHKGRIVVESEEGKGTTFQLIFPLGKDHLKAEEICEVESAKDYEIEKERIIPEEDEFIESKDKHRIMYNLSETQEKPALLIVEDNPDVRKYISMILEKQYRIYEAKDGEEGLNKSFELIPDLIISDIMMPKMNGLQMCSKLKTDTRTSHIPIIMLTAKATMKDKISGLELGADDYIMKPFEAEELKARIRNLLEQRKRLHEHFRKYGFVDIEQKNITSVDQKFLEKVVATINENFSDTSFGVDILADDLAVSQSLLYKKMNSLVGVSPNELIKRTRLNKAAKLIESNAGNISEIALEVGFNNPAYFSEAFKKHFGVVPSHYHQNNKTS